MVIACFRLQRDPDGTALNVAGLDSLAKDSGLETYKPPLTHFREKNTFWNTDFSGKPSFKTLYQFRVFTLSSHI